MALSYNQSIKTSQGDTITVSAGDGDIMKLSLSSPGMALLQIDVNNLITLFRGLSDAKLADSRFALNQKP